ncbi:DNA damage-inducible protein din7 [Plakobranchus ocellatus]|uniref:DNA damage-inducible protein din7 n=1 Tax=Plakobranchus ocellatus TaxID=259542 RepID=A0AAV3Z9T6_9GAST|nr:DNA damage-inducible protein din7 [Plakobranchus ocellatus]
MLLTNLEKFVCHLYGKPVYSSRNKLRYDLVRPYNIAKARGLLSSFEGFDISVLPPCREALKPHILLANYQTFIYGNRHIWLNQIYQIQKFMTGTEVTVECYQLSGAKIVVPQQLADFLSGSGTEQENIDGNRLRYLISAMDKIIFQTLKVTAMKNN